MDELEKFLKELGVDETTIKRFNKTQSKYKEYISDIRHFNSEVIHTPTVPPIYGKEQIKQREKITGEKPTDIITELELKQREEIETYERYKVSSTFLNNLKETDKYLKILGVDISLPTEWIEDILELLENAEKDDAEYFAYTINNKAEEFISTWAKYSSMSEEELKDCMNYENALHTVVDEFIETIQIYII